jgi:putative membrane protein
MQSLSVPLVAVVALIHAAIAVVEMAFWMRIHRRFPFAMSEAEARKAKPIVMNMGLYNGFLAAGLAWWLLSPAAGDALALFITACIVVAGVFGVATLGKTSLLAIQSLPAALAFAALIAR